MKNDVITRIFLKIYQTFEILAPKIGLSHKNDKMSSFQLNDKLGSHVIASDNEGKNLRSVKK